MSARRPAPRKRLSLGLFLAWAAFCMVLTSIPHLSVGAGIPGFDKAGHLGAYGGMAFLFVLWRRASGDAVRRTVVLACLFVAFWGCLDELHQLFIPGRSADVADWLADVGGGGAGMLSALLLPALFPALVSRDAQPVPNSKED